MSVVTDADHWWNDRDTIEEMEQGALRELTDLENKVAGGRQKR